MSSDSEDEDLLFFRGSENGRRRTTPKLMYLLTGLATISGFLFGYDTGVVSGALLLVRKDFNLTNVWHELIVSVTVGAAGIFSLITGSFADKWGRKPAILFASGAFALGSFVMGLATSKVMLLFGRFIVGIGVGVGSATVPVYISECSLPDHRGVLVTINTVAITGGQLIAGVVCGLFVEVSSGWRYMLAIAAAPAIIQLIGFLIMPESPRHLVKKEKYSEAYAVLSSIRGPYHQVQDELEDMKVSCTSSTTPGFLSSLKSILTSPTARKSVFLGCMLQFVQQAAGINTVMYYAASILSMAGANHGQAVWLSAVTAAVNFIFTLVGIYLVARWTRRRLLFSSLLSVTVSLLLISVSFEIIDSTAPHNSTNMTGPSHQPALSHVLTEGNVTTHSLPAELSVESVTAVGPIVALLSMCLYLASFAPGMGTLPWTINSEMHPHWCRAQAASLTTSTNWITNLVVSLTFLSLIERIGRPSTFLLYALFSLIGYIVLYFCLPETKGVALEEVEHLYERHSAPRQSGVYTRIAPRES